VSAYARPRSQATLLGALVSPPADWGLSGGEQADPVSDDDALPTESLRQPERFGHIYNRHFHGIYSYIASRRGPDAADDLTAETFIDAFRRRASFDHVLILGEQHFATCWPSTPGTTTATVGTKACSRNPRSASPATPSISPPGSSAERSSAA